MYIFRTISKAEIAQEKLDVVANIGNVTFLPKFSNFGSYMYELQRVAISGNFSGVLFLATCSAPKLPFLATFWSAENCWNWLWKIPLDLEADFWCKKNRPLIGCYHTSDMYKLHYFTIVRKLHQWATHRL